MVSAYRSMRCFLKGSNNSQLVQFSVGSEDTNDTGDGGGIPVFTFWSIPSFGMFKLFVYIFHRLRKKLLCLGLDYSRF